MRCRGGSRPWPKLQVQVPVVLVQPNSEPCHTARSRLDMHSAWPKLQVQVPPVSRRTVWRRQFWSDSNEFGPRQIHPYSVSLPPTYFLLSCFLPPTSSLVSFSTFPPSLFPLSTFNPSSLVSFSPTFPLFSLLWYNIFSLPLPSFSSLSLAFSPTHTLHSTVYCIPQNLFSSAFSLIQYFFSGLIFLLPLPLSSFYPLFN